jgi:hypothetical protein
MALSGNYHRDDMKIRHGEHRKVAIEELQELRSRCGQIDKEDIVLGIDKIFKELDDKIH